MPKRKDQPPRPKGIYGRVRAVIAYADLRAPVLAEALGVSATTISRWQGSGKPPDLNEQKRLAELCGVPLEFLQHGFPVIGHDGTGRLEDRVASLEERISRLEAR